MAQYQAIHQKMLWKKTLYYGGEIDRMRGLLLLPSFLLFVRFPPLLSLSRREMEEEATLCHVFVASQFAFPGGRILSCQLVWDLFMETQIEPTWKTE